MWSQHCVAARVCLSFTNSFNSKLLLGARACKSLVQQLFWSCSSQACLEGAKNREMAELGVKTKGFTFKEEAGTLSGAGLSNLRGGQWDAGADVVGQGLSCSPKAGEGTGHARQGQDCCGVGWVTWWLESLGLPFGVTPGVFPVSCQDSGRRVSTALSSVHSCSLAQTTHGPGNSAVEGSWK